MADFNTNNADEVASIYVQAILDTEKLEKSLDGLNKSKYQLNVSVDDSALYDLNKHLDLKYRHLKEVNNYFKQNPITPIVDTSYLDDLNKQLKDLTNSLNKTYTISVNQNVNVRLSDTSKREITESVTEGVEQGVGKGIHDMDKMIAKAVSDGIRAGSKSFSGASSSRGKQEGIEDIVGELKKGFYDLQKQIGNQLIGDALKTVLKPAKDFITGFSEGISNDLGKQVSKGLQTTFAKQLNMDFQKMGEQAGNKLLGAFGIKVKKENKLLTAIGDGSQIAIKSLSKSVERYAVRKLNKALTDSLDGIFADLFSTKEVETAVQQKAQAQVRKVQIRKRAKQVTNIPGFSYTTPTGYAPVSIPIEDGDVSQIPVNIPNVEKLPKLLNIPNIKKKQREVEKVLIENSLTPLETAARESNKNFGYVLNEIGKIKVKNSPVGGGNQTVKRVAKDIIKIKKAHQEAYTAFKNLLEAAQELGNYDLVDRLYADFSEKSKQAKSQIDSLINEGEKAGLKQKAITKFQRLKAPITSAEKNIKSKYFTIGRQAESEAVLIGSNAIAGLGIGLDNKAFAKFGLQNATAYLLAIKEAFQIKSPSRVMMQIGLNIIQGLMLGVQQQLPKLNQIIDGIKFKIETTFQNLKLSIPGIVGNLQNQASYNLANVYLNLPNQIRSRFDPLGLNLNNLSNNPNEENTVVQPKQAAKVAGLNMGDFLNERIIEGQVKSTLLFGGLISTVKGWLNFTKSVSGASLDLGIYKTQAAMLGMSLVFKSFTGLSKAVMGAFGQPIIENYEKAKEQGGQTLGQLLQDIFRSVTQTGIGAFGVNPKITGSNVLGGLGSLMQGDNKQALLQLLPLLTPILGLKGLNLGDAIVKILNNNLAIKPGFLNDLFRSLTGIKLEKTGLIGTITNTLGISKGSQSPINAPLSVISSQIGQNLSSVGTGGSIPKLIENTGQMLVSAVLKQFGVGGAMSLVIEGMLKNSITKVANLDIFTKTGGKGIGGRIRGIAESYAQGDVEGVIGKSSKLAGTILRTIGFRVDMKQLTLVMGTAIAGITAFHKAFTEEGLGLGQALLKGFKEAQKNWGNALDDMKIKAKQALGMDVLGDLTGNIVKKIRQGTVVTKKTFDEFFDALGKTFKEKALKGDKQGLFGNILGFGASISTMIAPITTMVAGLLPLLIPLMPLMGALGGIAVMVGGKISALAKSITEIEPLQRRLNFLGGSPEGGQREMAYAQSVANRLNVPVKEGIGAYSQLAIAARGTKLEGDGVKELYEGISSSLSALGISGQDASLVFMAYTQILAKGKLSMEELRQQLGEKFPPAMGLFAKAMGVSVAELGNMVSKGAILSEDVLPKVAKVLNEDYGKSAANSTTSLTAALTKLGNVGFDIALKLTRAFGSTFAMFTNFGANILGTFNNALEQLLPLFNSLVIGVTAVVGVGLATILRANPIATFLTTTQNLITAGLGKLLINLAPFYIGIIADVADGWLGAQNDLMDNMMKGVGNMAVAIATALDLLKRSFTGEALFGDFIGKQQAGNPLKGLIDGFTGLFRIIPSGVVEMGALILMFEQAQVLFKMFLAPVVKDSWTGFLNIIKSLGGMLTPVKTILSELLVNSTDLMRNLGSGKLKFGETFGNAWKTGLEQIKLGLKALTPLAIEAAIALGVLLFAKSDFTNPVSDAIGKMATEMNGAIKSINSSLNSLAKGFKSVGEAINSLPAKGLELNIKYALGLGGESFKTDNLIRNKNEALRNRDTSQMAWWEKDILGFIPGFGDSSAMRRLEQERQDRWNTKEYQGYKKTAEKYGINNVITGQEAELELSQIQLINQFRDIEKNTTGLGNFVNSNNLTKATASNLVSGDIKLAVDKVKELDARLLKLGKERSNLNLINTSEARTKISEIDKELLSLEKERTEAAKPFVAIFEDVESWGKSIDAMITAIDNSTNPPDVKRRLKESLEPMKQMAKEASDIVKNSLPVEPLKEVYTQTINALRDFETAYDKFTSTSKIDRANRTANLYGSGLSEGNINQNSSIFNIRDLQTDYNAIKASRDIRQKTLANLGSITNYGRTDEQKKELEDLRKNLRDDNERLAELGSNLSKAKYDLQQQLKQQTKQVADYYRTAVREAQTVTLEFEKAQANIKNLNVQNRLKEALLGAGDNIFTQFVDGLIQSLNELNEISNTQISAKQKENEYLNQIEDIKLQSAELQRSLPGEIVPFDSNVISQFNSQLQNVDKTVNQINASIDEVEQNLGSDIVEAAKKANEQLQIVDNQIKTVENSSKSWTNSLTSGFNSFIDNFKNGWQGVGQAIADVTGQSTNLIATLSSGTGIVGAIANGVQAANQGQLGSGVQQGLQQFAQNPIRFLKDQAIRLNSIGSFVSPIQGTTVDQLLKYKPSFGQSFYGIRDGGARRHSKIDFDSRAKAGQNAEILASLPGVATSRKWTGTSGGVFVNSLLPSGQKITLEYGHLSLASIKDALGGIGKQVQVQAGQKLGKVTMDALSTGAHLDFGVRINGKYTDPQKFMKDFTSGKYGAVGQAMDTAQQTRQYKTVPTVPPLPGGVLWGQAANYAPSNLSGLTPRGQKAMEALKNPNVRAFLDAVAVAELGNSAAKKGGYGYLFGDVGGKETFNPNSLGSHPMRRRSSGGYTSSATGRYQTMDFVWKEEAGRLGLKDFKPQSQEVLAVSRLMYRGILEDIKKGNFAGVINRPGYMDASSEWASIQGNPYGQGTKGGNRNVLLGNIQRNLQALNNTVLQNGSVTPNQMQQAVSQATQLKLNTAQSRYQTELLNSGVSQENINGKLIDFKRSLDSRIRGLQRGLFDAETARTQSSRSVQDMGVTNLFPVKSPEQQFLVDQENRTRQYDDKIRELKQKLTELQGNLTTSESAVQKAIADSSLKTLDPERYQKVVDGAKQAFASVQADIKAYGTDLATLEKQKAEALKLNTEHFNKTEYFRLAELSIQSETEKIGILQKQVEQYKLLEQVDPLNALVLKIPSLERNIALMTAEKDLRQEIINADKEYYNQQLTPAQYQEKIQNAIKQNELQKQSIELTKNQAQITADLNRRTIELEKSQFLQQTKLKALQLENQGLTLNSRNGIVDLTTVTNELLIKTTELTQEYENQSLALAKRNDLSAQEKLIQSLQQSKNFNRELELVKRESEFRKKETELIINPQAELNNANRRDELLNNPGLELRQLQIDSFRNRGGNEFVANRMSRDLAMEQEKGRFETQLAQLKIDIAKFNLENPNIAITTEELNKLTESVHALHNANIQKIGMDFKTFGMSLNSMVNDAVKSLGSGLVDLIKGTKSLEDVLDGFFDQILTGFLNMGIQSLLGGIFGGGGGLFGGLFGFAKGGIVPNYALGGIHQAMTKEVLQSGRKPMLAVVHQGEMLIPADRMAQLERAGITANSLLGNYAKGGVVGSMPNSTASKVTEQGRNGGEQTITVESTVINSIEYVTVDQFREGMIQAAKKGANDGAARVQNKMANSPSWRRSVGI